MLRRFATVPKLKHFKLKAKPLWSLVWVGSGAALVGGLYYATHLEKVPISGRTRFITTSPQQEEAIGDTLYREVMRTFRSRLLPPSHPVSQYVNKVVQRLINVSGAPGKWEVHVIQDPTFNAFVIPGGKIFVHTGLFPVDEDGLAAVLGHEMAHNLARHTGENLSFIGLLMKIRFLTAIIFDISPVIQALVIKYGIMMPFSRSCESEADQIGLLLMAKACYDPAKAVSIWEVLQHSYKKLDRTTPKGSEYLSTHPSHRTRAARLKEWLPEARREFEKAGCHQKTASFMDVLHNF